jgi:hypothetical protein
MQEHSTPVFKNVVNALDSYIQSTYPQDAHMELKPAHIATTRFILYAFIL